MHPHPAPGAEERRLTLTPFCEPQTCPGAAHRYIVVKQILPVSSSHYRQRAVCTQADQAVPSPVRDFLNLWASFALSSKLLCSFGCHFHVVPQAANRLKSLLISLRSETKNKIHTFRERYETAGVRFVPVSSEAMLELGSGASSETGCLVLLISLLPSLLSSRENNVFSISIRMCCGQGPRFHVLFL